MTRPGWQSCLAQSLFARAFHNFADINEISTPMDKPSKRTLR